MGETIRKTIRKVSFRALVAERRLAEQWATRAHILGLLSDPFPSDRLAAAITIIQGDFSPEQKEQAVRAIASRFACAYKTFCRPGNKPPALGMNRVPPFFLMLLAHDEKFVAAVHSQWLKWKPEPTIEQRYKQKYYKGLPVREMYDMVELENGGRLSAIYLTVERISLDAMATNPLDDEYRLIGLGIDGKRFYWRTE